MPAAGDTVSCQLTHCVALQKGTDSGGAIKRHSCHPVEPVPPASPLLLVRPSIEVQSKGDSGGGGDGGAGDADEHGGVVQMSMAATGPAAARNPPRFSVHSCAC